MKYGDLPSDDGKQECVMAWKGKDWRIFVNLPDMDNGLYIVLQPVRTQSI